MRGATGFTVGRRAAVVLLLGLAAGVPATCGERASAVSPPEGKPAGPGVTMTTSLSNSGWMVVLYFAEQGIREILYRLDEAGDFQSTGFSRVIDPKTGYPLPNTYFQLPAEVARSDRHTLVVKWRDAEGREQGPRQLSFSLTEEAVGAARHVLETVTPNDWIAFREYPKGTLLVYFTHLLSHRNALREIRYSLDDASLSQTLPFETATDLSTAPTVGDGPLYLKVPLATRSVSVKLRYLDGSESAVRTFPVR